MLTFQCQQDIFKHRQIVIDIRVLKLASNATARNFMGAATSSVAAITVASEPVPQVTIDGATTRQVRVNQGVTLNARAIRSSCAANAHTVEM